MFICEICNKQVKEGISPTMVVLDRREKNYPTRFNQTTGEVIDKGGIGEEIVKEAKACPSCAKAVDIHNKTP
jgi:hypothetical protein